LVSERELRYLGEAVIAQVETRQLTQPGKRAVDRRQSVVGQIEVK